MNHPLLPWSVAAFNFRVPNMHQVDADTLWDCILDELEALGYPRSSAMGTYEVLYPLAKEKEVKDETP